MPKFKVGDIITSDKYLVGRFEIVSLVNQVDWSKECIFAMKNIMGTYYESDFRLAKPAELVLYG